MVLINLNKVTEKLQNDTGLMTRFCHVMWRENDIKTIVKDCQVNYKCDLKWTTTAYYDVNNSLCYILILTLHSLLKDCFVVENDYKLIEF